MTDLDDRARFRGCLLGGAAGDALGAPVEFLKRQQIVDRFGPEGISDYAPAYGRLGAITDDTQMTLFTAEGLIRSWVRGSLKGITTEVGVTAHAYLRWLKTQGEQPIHDIGFVDEDPSWLIQQSALHHRRAPGNTCLSALKQMRYLGEFPARNDSNGCGAVMRMAPAGLFAASIGPAFDTEAVFTLGTELSAITHGHPTGALAGGAFAALILELARGALLPTALATVMELLTKQPQHEETLHALQSAIRLAASAVDHPRAIAELGRGWVAEEALAISTYCALVADDFKHGVILAVNHDGDSDSTGSITGNVLGVIHGIEAIPTEWLERLELRDTIQEVADDLLDFPSWKLSEYGDGDFTERISRYPGD